MFSPISLRQTRLARWRSRRINVHRRQGILLCTVLGFLGCSSDQWAEVFPVSGVVKYDGQIPVGAQIVLHPVAAAASDAVAPTGRVKADGSFVITSYQAGDGAPPGDYVVTIQWYKIEKDGVVGPNVIPDQYVSPKTSPIKVSVQSGGPTALEPIAISSAKTARKPGGGRR
jgi:hypothetical protein